MVGILRVQSMIAQPQVHAAVIVHEEHVLSIVAALGDVVRQTGHDDSGDTGHDVRLSAKPMAVN
jgi:hypothetical protein